MSSPDDPTKRQRVDDGTQKQEALAQDPSGSSSWLTGSNEGEMSDLFSMSSEHQESELSSSMAELFPMETEEPLDLSMSSGLGSSSDQAEMSLDLDSFLDSYVLEEGMPTPTFSPGTIDSFMSLASTPKAPAHQPFGPDLSSAAPAPAVPSVPSGTAPYGDQAHILEYLPRDVSQYYLRNWTHFQDRNIVDAYDFVNINLYSENNFVFAVPTTLGGGTYSAVFRAMYRDSMDSAQPQFVAIKKTDCPDADPKTPGKKVAYLRESEILGLLQTRAHDNVVSLIEKWESGIFGPKRYYIALELSPIGDMFTVLKADVGGQDRWVPLKDMFVRHLIRGVAEGVQHLFSLGIAHGDLKFENVLLYWTSEKPIEVSERIMAMTPKLTDFNNSQRGPPNGPIWCDHPRCTITTAAPESWHTVKQWNMIPADVYSVGAMLLAMLTASFVFMPPNELYTLNAEPALVSTRTNEFRDVPLTEISTFIKYEMSVVRKATDPLGQNLKDLILKTLTPSPVKRITIGQFLAHQWFTNIEATETSSD